jgi:hypothetical protein
MKVKTKTIEIDGTRYQLKRFLPDVGSFLRWKLLAALQNDQSSTAEQAPVPPGEPAPAATPNGEDLARAMVLAAFLYGKGIDLQSHREILNHCMAACARWESGPSGDIAMPIFNGQRLLPDIADDPVLVDRLQVEVLVFNFSDFFAAGGLKTMAGTPPQAA